MAKKTKAPNEAAQDKVLATMGEELPNEKPEKVTPAYQVVGESKIPVSKAFGKTVECRKKAAITAYEITRRAWNEAYRYYNHNQVSDEVMRTQAGDRAFRSGDGYENLVYANTSTMVPAIFAKNPDVEFTTDQDEDKPFAKLLSRAVTTLFNRKSYPGINLKPKAKKAVLHAELTNCGILKLDYTQKEDSREFAQEQMDKLYQEMEKAKDQEEVREIEGKMAALESNMEWLEPSGFKVSVVLPRSLIIDPCAESEDGSDANWMLEETFISTDFLNAKFTTKDASKERASIYKPTHKIKLDGSGQRDDMLGLVLEAVEQGTEEAPANTDEQRQSYIYQNMTKCYYYYDKITRRTYLFVDNDWTWPVWVWEDGLTLSRYFQFFLINFAPSTGGTVSPGEVSYYLDQQDEINKINQEVIRARRMIFNVLVYNKNKIAPDDAKKLANYLKTGKGDNILGINVPEGMVIKDAMEVMAPPSVTMEKFFDKTNSYKAIDRIGSVTDAIRGEQFKTNTTNKAVEAYTSSARVRVGNRTDSIEDTIGDLAWSMAEILVAKGSKELIAGLVGDTVAKDWKSMTIAELNLNFGAKVAAGSSEKPTSQFKKEEAVKVATAVGQFAKGAPGATLKIILKLLSNAFPELSITDEDWSGILTEMQATMQKGISTGGGGPGQQPGQPQPQQGGMPGQPQPMPNGQGMPQDIQEMLDSLPLPLKEQVVNAVRQGATPQQALQPIMEKLNATPRTA
jgi:hypothetical protein